MKYATGEDVKIGDVVLISRGDEGEVVCIIDDGIYSKKYTKENWAYLKHGVLIESTTYGTIHYAYNLDEELNLVSRCRKK